MLYLLCIYFNLLWFLQHQQQVAAAVERAKQVTMQELNAIIGVCSFLALSLRKLLVEDCLLLYE